MFAPTRSRCLGLLAATALLSGCDMNLTERALVDQLRVLGVKAEPPEATPGSEVALSALVADPFGGGRPVTHTWGVCTPTPYVGVASCGDEGNTLPLGTGTAQTLTLATTLLDGLDLESAEQGIDLFVVLAVNVPETVSEPAATELAYKRVRVSTSLEPNHNPASATLLADGSATLIANGERVTLQATVSEDSVETFLNPLGELEPEELKFSWFSTGGEWERALSFGDAITGASENEWTPPEENPADVWIVIRDTRGGIDWFTRRANP